jgi:hypothetical protein
LRDFTLSTAYQPSHQNDPTQRFTLAKKEKKGPAAADLLMNLQFETQEVPAINAL